MWGSLREPDQDDEFLGDGTNRVGSPSEHSAATMLASADLGRGGGGRVGTEPARRFGAREVLERVERHGDLLEALLHSGPTCPLVDRLA